MTTPQAPELHEGTLQRIEELVQRTQHSLVAGLEAALLRQGTPFYAAYEARPLEELDAIMARFNGEPRQFVQAIFGAAKKGRDHNSKGFSIWLAGGGVKGGHVHGATDEFGVEAIEGKVHVHDLHATMLHLLGFDHTKLTYRYAGRDFRLTDVEGRVVREILA